VVEWLELSEILGSAAADDACVAPVSVHAGRVYVDVAVDRIKEIQPEGIAG